MKNIGLNLYGDFAEAANGMMAWGAFAAARDRKAKTFSVEELTDTRIRFSDGLAFDIPAASALNMKSWGPLQWCRWRAIYGGITPQSAASNHESKGSGERADGDGRTVGEYRAALEELTGHNW